MINRRQALSCSTRLCALPAGAGVPLSPTVAGSAGASVPASGFRPALHVAEVAARHNGKMVLTVLCGPSVSGDPYLQFRPKGAGPGDKTAVGWKENRGAARTHEVTVA